MQFDRIGPFAFWRMFGDDWIQSRQAAKLFFVSALAVLALTPFLLGKINPSVTTPWQRFSLGVLGFVCPIGLFFLWFGMWRYWFRIDNSSVLAKRLWFIILLAGFFWGSCIYFFFAYLPRVTSIRRSDP